MRERWARLLAALTGVLVVLLSAGFAVVQNPGGESAALAEAKSTSAVDAERLAQGRAVYDEQGCARCHAIAGQGSPRSPLDGVGTRLDAAELRHYVIGDPAIADDLSPRTLAAKRPYAELPPEQLDALVDYLRSL